MKKYISVAMAAVRPIVWKLLLIILAMTAVETGLFLLRWNSIEYRARFLNSLYIFPRIVYSLALIGLTAVIMRQGGWLSGGTPAYTMRRLPVSEGAVVLIWAAVYFAAYLILRAAQIGFIFGIWKIFGDCSRFQLMMRFYDDDFLHGLFSMANVCGHIRHLIWPMAMALTLSFSVYARYRGAEQISPYVLLAVELCLMESHYDMVWIDVCVTLFVVLVTVISVYNAWRSDYAEI